jgi:hypothetical protein
VISSSSAAGSGSDSASPIRWPTRWQQTSPPISKRPRLKVSPQANTSEAARRILVRLPPSWAAERGVIPAPSRPKGRRTPRALAVFTAAGVIAMVVAVLLLATGEPKVTLTARTMRSPLPTSGGGAAASTTVHRVQASAAAPIELMLLFLAIAALGFAAWLWSRSGRSRPPTAPA